jgi:hypothetical protein
MIPQEQFQMRPQMPVGEYDANKNARNAVAYGSAAGTLGLGALALNKHRGGVIKGAKTLSYYNRNKNMHSFNLEQSQNSLASLKSSRAFMKKNNMKGSLSRNAEAINRHKKEIERASRGLNSVESRISETSKAISKARGTRNKYLLGAAALAAVGTLGYNALNKNKGKIDGTI